jgi:succinate dehydrogenase/fumarate reductase flavoprotein subunit
MHSSFDADAKEFDVIVAGSGAAGLATAVSCRILGLSTMLLEASPWIGGSTALSGGVLWIPGNPYRPASPEPEDLEHALAYIRAECGTNFDQSAARAFVQAAGASVSFSRSRVGLHTQGLPFGRTITRNFTERERVVDRCESRTLTDGCSEKYFPGFDDPCDR